MTRVKGVQGERACVGAFEALEFSCLTISVQTLKGAQRWIESKFGHSVVELDDKDQVGYYGIGPFLMHPVIRYVQSLHRSTVAHWYAICFV